MEENSCPPNYNLWDLHVAIQDSMGWLDYHLHCFEIAKGEKIVARIGIPDFDDFDEDYETFPCWEIPVLEIFKEPGIATEYLYDYGDEWYHSVRLEAIYFKDKDEKYPKCIDGAGACPPEDCGGVRGYSELVEIMKVKKSKKYEEIKMWLGKDFEPEKFEKNSIRFDNPRKRWENAFLKR